jgi:hypothetical protein
MIFFIVIISYSLEYIYQRISADVGSVSSAFHCRGVNIWCLTYADCIYIYIENI